MSVDDVKNFFDFEENAYFYHITGDDLGDTIIEEGLLVEGTNILDVKNIMFTTAVPITPDMVERLEEILEEELKEDYVRGTSQMVILGCNKNNVDSIVQKMEIVKDGVHYDGIVHPNNVMGYFDLDYGFIQNENFDYGSNEFYEFDSFSK